MNSPIKTLEVSENRASPRVKNLSKTSSLSYRLMITYRFALALIGGYILAALSAMVIAQYFSDHRGSAAMSATLIAFTIWSGVFIWVFMVNKTLKASLGVILPIVVFYILYKLLGN
jgi:hypothetical protein